jgi:16S rRNA (guanine(966)-N(2))-methyltransferase RsmD
VREALFSALGTLVINARVLDLFAGTGAFGFEALSRGAASAVFVERNRRVCGLIAETSRRLGVESQVRILAMDAIDAMRRLDKEGARFDFIFLDPPYESEWIARTLSDPMFPNLLESEGVFIVEKRICDRETQPPQGFEKRFSRKYGEVLLEIFHRV